LKKQWGGALLGITMVCKIVFALFHQLFSSSPLSPYSLPLLKEKRKGKPKITLIFQHPPQLGHQDSHSA